MRSVVFLSLLTLAFATQAVAETILFGMSVSRQMLLTVDVDTGQPTDVGSVGTHIQDIAFNSSDGFLYGYGPGTGGRLLRIDPVTASTTSIGEAPGVDFGIQGMTYDANGDQIYASGTYYDLLRVDPYTGAATLLGQTPEMVWGLAFDAMTDTLYGWTTNWVPVIIDPQDASLTPVGDGSQIAPVEGLTFDAGSGLLYAVFLGAPVEDSVLATIDPVTADVTEIGALGTEDFISGLAMTPEPCTLVLLASGLIGLRKQRCR